MNKRILSFAVLCLICACAFALTTHFSFAKSDDDAKTLTALDNDWSKAAVARDVSKVASFYADDASVYPPNEKMVKGRAAAQKLWGEALNTPGYTISWKTVSAGTDGNLGYTAGTYTESMKAADGKTTNGTGKYLCVWRKGSDGKWKAIHDMWNSDTK